VTLRNGGVQIQGDATARSNGAKGDMVRLELDGSKKLVQGVVTGPGRAVIDVKG
jgi:flagella basal body P-ring formation protein FlgA